MAEIIQPMRHLSFGAPFTFVLGNPALLNAGTLGATMQFPEDGILNWIHIEYGAGVFITSAGPSIGDVAGAFLMEGVSAGVVNIGSTSYSPGVLWNRSDNALAAVAGNFTTVFSTSADIQYSGKLVRQGTAFTVYLVTPSYATTGVQYGVQVCMNYWSLDAYRSQNKNNQFMASIKS